jgi:hypothetical protein
MKIHDVFHATLLHAHTPNDIPGHIPPPPPITIVNSQEEQDVEEIVDSRTYHGALQYRVRWKGEPETTWEPADNVTNSQDLMDRFHELFPKKL